MLAMKFFRRAIAALGSLGALTSACCAAGSADATSSTSVSTNVNTPAPIEVRVLDADETLYNSGTYFNPQNMGNGVWSIGHQRQGGTYEVPLELKNISAGEDLGLFVSVVLAADDWIVEQDPSGSVVDVGESAYARIRLDTAAPMASPSICAIQLIITQGSTSYDPIMIVLRAESVQAENQHPSGVDALPAPDSLGLPPVPSWYPDPSGPEILKPAANFTRAPHAFIGNVSDPMVKPSMNLGVHAAIEGGISKVEFYIKGATTTVTQEVLDPGMAASDAVPGYYVKLVPGNFPGTGGIERVSVYARAWANDPTLMPRVIGPWVFYVVRQSSAINPLSVPGTTSIYAASGDPTTHLWQRLKSLSNANPAPANVITVLELESNNHILPTFEQKIWAGATAESMGTFAGWDWPLVIRRKAGHNPVLITSQTPGNSPASSSQPGNAALRAPIVIYWDLAFDQSKVRTLYCDKTLPSPTSVATDNVFIDCHFLNTSVPSNFPAAPLNQGRYALYKKDFTLASTASDAGLPVDWIITHQGRDSSGSKVTRLYFEDCVFGDDPLTPADEGSIYRGVNAAELLWRCRFGQLAHDATNNAVAMFKCVIRDVNAQPPRSDIPVGRLTYTGSGPGHIRKTGSSGDRYDVKGADVVGALLLYEDDGLIPKHVIALSPATCQLPTAWITAYPNLCNTGWHTVTSLDDLADLLESLGAPWTFTRDPGGVGASGNGINARSPSFLTCPCQGGGGPFGSTVPAERIKDVVLSTMIDAHNDALQWFSDSYVPAGGSLTFLPIDNRTYWGIDADFRPTTYPSLLYPTSPNYPATGGPFPLGYGELVPSTMPLVGPQPNTFFNPANAAMPCGDVGSSSSRLFAYPQGIIINDAAPGAFNSAIRAVRFHMRENYDHAPTGSQFGAPMTNTLVTNVSLVGQSLALRNDDPAPYRFFDPLRLTIRDSSFLCIGLTNFYPITDPPNAQWLCCGTLNGTVPPQYNIGEILASNNHYVFVCGSTTCNAITPWSGPGNPMGFCVAPQGGGPPQPAGGQLGVYAAPGLNTGGDNTWGYGELLNDKGQPILLSEGVSSPLVRRTRVIRLKYYMDGEPVDTCGSTNGADPIGPLGDQ